MARMQDVVAAVGEHHGLARRLPMRALSDQIRALVEISHVFLLLTNSDQPLTSPSMSRLLCEAIDYFYTVASASNVKPDIVDFSFGVWRKAKSHQRLFCSAAS